MTDKTTKQADSLDRMADLTRKVIAVKKSELPKIKPKKRKKH